MEACLPHRAKCSEARLTFSTLGAGGTSDDPCGTHIFSTKNSRRTIGTHVVLHRSFSIHMCEQVLCIFFCHNMLFMCFNVCLHYCRKGAVLRDNSNALWLTSGRHTAEKHLVTLRMRQLETQRQWLSSAFHCAQCEVSVSKLTLFKNEEETGIIASVPGTLPNNVPLTASRERFLGPNREEHTICSHCPCWCNAHTCTRTTLNNTTKQPQQRPQCKGWQNDRCALPFQTIRMRSM